MQVIATLGRVQVWKALTCFAAITALYLAVPVLIYSDPGFFFGQRMSVAAVIGGLIFFLGVFPYAVLNAWRLYKRGGRQVWIDGGRLIFYGTHEVFLSRIKSVSLGRHYVGVPQLEFLLEDGSRQTIIFYGQSISPEAMVARLREICGLPKS